MNTEYVNSKKKIKIFKSLFRQGKKITKDSPRKKEARVLSPADFISMNSLRKSIVNSSFD